MNKSFEMPTISVILLNGADIVCASGCQTMGGGDSETKIT